MSNKRSTTLTVSIKAVDEDTKELVEDYSFECESLTYAQAKSADEMLKELFNELPEELQFLLKMAAEDTEDDLGESSELFDHILRNAPNPSYGTLSF